MRVTRDIAVPRDACVPCDIRVAVTRRGNEVVPRDGNAYERTNERTRYYISRDRSSVRDMSRPSTRNAQDAGRTVPHMTPEEPDTPAPDEPDTPSEPEPE